MRKLFDLHSDLLTSDTSLSEQKKILKDCDSMDIKTVYAVYKGDLTFDKAVKKAKWGHDNGALYIAFENCCYINNQINAEYEMPFQFEILASFKPLYASLTWNNENGFASGCAASGGLKKIGSMAIGLLNEHNIPIDGAHLNKSSFISAIKQANRFLVSHTAFDFCYRHRRNIDEEQVKLILDNGGIIGITAVGHFLTADKEYEIGFYRQIGEYYKQFGVNGLAIGTDFYGTDAPVYTHGDYSFVEVLYKNLSKLGISSAKAEKIAYKNAYEFYDLL